MKGRSAAERIAIHLAILFALAVPVSARGLQAPSIARQLKTEGGETESFTTPSASTRNNSTTTRAIIKLKAPVASPASQSIGSLKLPGMGNEQVPWSIVVLLTTLTLIPSILVCMTPFARILIVFHFLRQALGLQTTPSNQTLIGLSLISKDPIRHFMGHYVREKDLALFLELAKEPTPASMNDVSLRVMLPAYILSELKAGFQIGAVLFLPFLIVDMVVASITTSVGMLQLPPVVISTPLKLLLFLMVDGWHLLIGSLMRSFY